MNRVRNIILLLLFPALILLLWVVGKNESSQDRRSSMALPSGSRDGAPHGLSGPMPSAHNGSQPQPGHRTPTDETTSRVGAKMESRTAYQAYPPLASLELAQRYAKTDPEGGFQWIANLDPKAEGRDGLVDCFARALGSVRAQDWDKYLRRIRDPRTHDMFLFGLVSGLGSVDAEAAWRECTLRESTTQEPSAFRKDVLKDLARKNPVNTWPIVVALSQDPLVAQETLELYFRNAQFQDQSEALGLIRGINHADLAKSCLEFYSQFVQPSEAVALANAIVSSDLPPSDRDPAIAILVDRIFPDDLDAAARLSLALQDKAIRNQTTEKVRRFAWSKGPALGKQVDHLLGL